MTQLNDDKVLVAVLPRGDWETISPGEDVEIYEAEADVIQDLMEKGRRDVYVEDMSGPPVMKVAEVLQQGLFRGPIPEGEPSYQVLVNVTEAEFHALADAGRRPTLLEWNDGSQAILHTDLGRAFIAAIQTVDEKYEDMHPADGDFVDLESMNLPTLREMLRAFCISYDNHPESGLWWNGDADETNALLEKYPMVREFAAEALVAFRAEEAKYDAQRPEPPEFPTYVGWDGQEHAEF